MTFHDSIKHTPRSSRVIATCHEHDGSELMLVAPWRKHLTFSFGSSVGSRDLHHIRHAERPQLADLLRGLILIRETPADELAVFVYTRRVAKNGNSRCDPALHEV